MTKIEALRQYLNETIDKYNPWCHDMKLREREYKYNDQGGIVTCECWLVYSPHFTPLPLIATIKEIVAEIGIDASVHDGINGVLIKFSPDFSKDLSWQDEEYISNIQEGWYVPLFKAPLEDLPMYEDLNNYFTDYWKNEQKD